MQWHKYAKICKYANLQIYMQICNDTNLHISKCTMTDIAVTANTSLCNYILQNSIIVPKYQCICNSDNVMGRVTFWHNTCVTAHVDNNASWWPIIWWHYRLGWNWADVENISRPIPPTPCPAPWVGYSAWPSVNSIWSSAIFNRLNRYWCQCFPKLSLKEFISYEELGY